MPDPRQILTLAATAQCDTRTARAYLEGRDPRGNMLRARLSDAARSIGVERASAPPAPTNPPPRAA